MVNHQPNEWEWNGHKFVVNPGQVVTSLEKISKLSGKGISIQNVRSALNRFKKYEFLTYEVTKTGRLITILNWGLYQVEENQPNKEPNKEVTKTQQTGNKEVTTNKNDKNDKNDKEDINIVQQADEIWSLYPEKKGKAKAAPKIPKLIKKYGFEQLQRCIERYMQYVEQRRKKFPDFNYQNGSTFFNSGYSDYLDENWKEEEDGELTGNNPKNTKEDTGEQVKYDWSKYGG